MPSEPWLRGIDHKHDPVLAHLLRASQHIREDVASAVTPLSAEQLWLRPGTMNPVGFHLKHLAGSTDRLLTYLRGESLSAAQLATLRTESAGDEDADTLLSAVNAAFDRYDAAVRTLQPEEFAETRRVGRAQLEVTAISLAIHIAEHGHRHTGQIVSAATLARAAKP